MLSNMVGIFGIAMVVFIVLAIRTHKNKTGQMKKWILYAAGCFIIAVLLSVFLPPQKLDSSKPASSNVNTSSTSNSNITANTTTQTPAKKKQNKAETQTASTDKATQQAELQALGDWGIKSNKDDFTNRYTQIQKYMAAGDRQSAYDEAKLASKRADDLNSKTMNNQDIANVPKDIPANVRDILNGVDSDLAQGFMLEKQGFDALADGINNNDVSKINSAKDNFSLANDEFNQAKALINKANAMLK